jgi:hypothetical protein
MATLVLIFLVSEVILNVPNKDTSFFPCSSGLWAKAAQMLRKRTGRTRQMIRLNMFSPLEVKKATL